MQWMSTVRGRLGWAASSTFFYFTGGLAVARFADQWGIPTTPNGLITSSGIRTAPVFGGGIEYMLSRNWSVKAEALYADFGSTTTTVSYAGSSYRTGFSHATTIARGGLNFKW
jgi:outer membrane immunogenic protein